MAALAGIGTALTIGAAVVGGVASVYSAYSTYQQGVAQKNELDRQAGVDELTAKNEYASSQREAEQRRLEGALVQSRQQAYAAASGGGAGGDDPTIVKIMGETGAKAQFGSDAALYQGDQARDAYLSEASAKRTSGQNNFFGSILRATGTLAGGIGHLGEGLAPMFPTRTVAPNVWGGAGALG